METTIVSSVIRSSRLISPISSPLISVRRLSPYLRFSSWQIAANDRQDVLLVGQDAQILGDFLEQLCVLAAEFFLLQVDQLAERHSQNGVGLHGGERVGSAHAAFLLEHGEAGVAQGSLHHGRRGFDAHQAGLGLGLRRRGANDANDLVDIGVGQQQAFDRVLALPGLGQQELRAAANDGRPVPDELFQQAP